MASLQTLKSLVNERLSAAAEEIFWTIGRILTFYEDESLSLKQEIDHKRKLLDMILKPHSKLHRADILLDTWHLPLYEQQEVKWWSLVHEEPKVPQIKEEQHERSSSLVQEEPETPQSKEEQHESSSLVQDEPEPPQIKEEQHESSSLVQEEPEPPQSKEEKEEQCQRAEEDDDGSTLTLVPVKCEDDKATKETEPLASTSTEQMAKQADLEDCGTSQPTCDDMVLSSHGSESGTDDSKDWETRDWETLKSHSAQHVGGNTLSLNKQSHSMKSQLEKKNFGCMYCGKIFLYKAGLKRHTMIHTGERPYACAFCGKSYVQNITLQTHLRTHTGETPFTCTVCGKGCSQKIDLKRHMRTHTGEKPVECMVCGRGFRQIGHLKNHMMTHTKGITVK